MIEAVSPGDVVISPTNGEERVVVDVADYRHQDGFDRNAVTRDALRSVVCVLRYPDGDERRELDDENGDMYLFSETAADLTATGRRFDDA